MPGAELPLVTALPFVALLLAIALAPLADTGIWEFRTMPRHYTFSRAMCWAAIDRGAMIAQALGETTIAAKWHAHSLEEREIVVARGYNERVGCFTQAFGGEHGDCAGVRSIGCGGRCAQRC